MQHLFLNLTNYGKAKEYTNARDLVADAIKYFQWAEEHPLLEEKMFAHQGATFTGNQKKMRAYSYKALAVYLNVPESRLNKYRRNPDFQDAMEMIDNVIFTQKFEAAAAGLLNSGLISRDLGLAEKSEISGPGGSAVPVTFQITPIAHGSYLTEEETKQQEQGPDDA